MSDNQFDQQFNEVLKNLDIPYDPSTWDMLERRMNAGFSEEHPAPVDEVDKAVYHVLDRLESPYQAAHWHLLAQRMQGQVMLIRRLRLAKLAEAAILLLVLLNLDTFSASVPPTERLPEKRRPDVPVAHNGRGRQLPQVNNTGNLADSEYSSDQTIWIETAINKVLSGSNTPDLLSNDYRSEANVLTVLSGLQSLAEQASKPVYAAVPGMDLLPLNAPAVENTPSDPSIWPATSTKIFRQKSPVYLAVFAAGDQNRVLVNANKRITGGYGAGLNLGYRKNGWGIETGVEYAHKNYTPKKQIEIYAGDLQQGYLGSYMTEVQASMVSIPLKASRRIARAGKTSAHAVAGVSASVAMEKRYDYATVYYPPGHFPSALPLHNPGMKPQLQQSGRGVLEKNGRLADNFCASLDAGVRIEHSMGKGRYTAFVEPSFKQSLTGKGVGPNREPINSFSVKAGVMAFL